MRDPLRSILGQGAGARRGGHEPLRPIASGLRLDPDHVDLIDQSHERCAALGVSRIERPDLAPLARNELALARERNLRLLQHAAPVMAMLHEQIVNTESMVVLCDDSGTILHSIGDDDFLERASKVALQPGVNWSEQTKGTNAIGTALIAEAPTLVHADEHYLHANQFLTCSAAPILDPRGNILGVLDVTGDRGGFHQHTMALVKMSSRMIENRWLSDDYRHVMRLHFHSRAEFIGTLVEGILAVGPDGRLVGANRGALEQLGLSGAALRLHSLDSLFGTRIGVLVDHFRSSLAAPMPVRLHDGRWFHLQARFNGPVWAGTADGGALAAPAPLLPAPNGSLAAASAAGGALARLCTGDAQLAAQVDKVRRVLDRGIPLLILGESGSGKSQLAQAVHADSARAHRPFVTVDCAALPEPQLEAELFGAWQATGPGTSGSIAQANGGTLYLAHVGDLPLALQARLSRLLQERRTPLPGHSAPVAPDLMLICADTRPLRPLVDRQAFREDLYQLISGLPVRLPPLRERSDLLPLARSLLVGLAEQDRRQRPLALDAEVQRLFQSHAWPGNVRQLATLLRTAAALAGGQAWIARDHLTDDFLLGCAAIDLAAPAEGSPADAPQRPDGLAPTDAPSSDATASLAQWEVDAIQAAVSAAGGNIAEAARRLGISRNTIYRKLRWNRPA